MLSLKNQISMLKTQYLNKQSVVGSKKQDVSLIDYSNPNTFEVAERLRVQFAGLHQQAQERQVSKAIKAEFGKDMPALKNKVGEKLFPGSSKSPKTIGIV